MFEYSIIGCYHLGSTEYTVPLNAKCNHSVFTQFSTAICVINILLDQHTPHLLHPTSHTTIHPRNLIPNPIDLD